MICGTFTGKGTRSGLRKATKSKGGPRTNMKGYGLAWVDDLRLCLADIPVAGG
jgi:hypothetical protein